MLWFVFFVSIFLSSLFAFTLILMLNYLTFKWENERVNALASKVNRINNDSILNKTEIQREFLAVDFKGFQKELKGRSRSLMIVNYDEYPEWFKKIILTSNKFRKNTFKSTTEFFGYLISLAQPAKTELTKAEEKVAKEKKEEINNLVNKVAKDNPHFQEKTNTLLSLPYTPQKKKTKPGATLDLVANIQSNDSSQFEKMEARILQKLKNSGLDSYNIWLELGDLYIKYDQPEKAKEIYALVLKHSQDNQKEMARNKLIGI